MHAIGQGALAVECRTDDKKILDMLKPLNDKATVQAVMAERALMRTLVCLRNFKNYNCLLTALTTYTYFMSNNHPQKCAFHCM